MIKTDNGDCWHNIMTFMKETLKVGDRAVLVVIGDLLYIGVGDWFELYTAGNRELRANTTSTKARTSSENATSRFCNHFQLFKLIMLEKCVLTILELSWNLRLGNKKTKLNICHHVLTSSTQLQNRSFHVVERTRTSTKCQKMKSARAKRAKILFFIVKYANLWGLCCRRHLGCLSSLIIQY